MLSLSQLRQAVCKGYTKNGIVVHVQQSQRAINWDKAKVEKVVP